MMSFFRAWFQSWQQLARQAWLWLATLVVFCLAFFAVNTLVVTNVLADRLIDAARQRVDISVTFLPGAPPAIIEQARTYLLSLPETAKIEVMTADQALEAFRARYRQEESVLTALDEVGRNPLGASFTVQAKTLEGYAVISEALQLPVYKEWIQSKPLLDHQEAIQELESLRRAVRLVGTLLLALFVCIALLLLVNVVRMVMFTQRDEIAIMRLVGATKWRIRLPYALSVIWVTLLAWGTTVLGAMAVYRWFLPQSFGWMREGLVAIADFFQASGPFLLGAQLLVASVVASLIAWIAAGKYMKK